MKILITGGHMAPALAVIQKLPKHTDIVYVGRIHPFEGDKGVSLEYQTVMELGIRFIPLVAGRIQRHVSFHTFQSLLKVPGGFYQAYKILCKEKPDIVLGFGGYVSMPIGFMATFLKIPLIIHEQTLAAGLANKLLGKVATAVCISWPSSQKFFPKGKTILTGNPLMEGDNQDITFLLPASREKLPLLVIVGGSAGSHAINHLIEGILEELLKKFQVVHQTGDAKEFGDYERLMEKRNSLQKHLRDRYTVYKFISPDAISSLFKRADLVVSRSGINTVTTLLYLRKPSLLIPLPYGQYKEQLTNALMFEATGLGMVLEESSATSAGLFERVTAMIDTLASYHVKKGVDFPTNAADRIVEVISLCYKEVFKKEKLVTSYAE